MIAQRAWWRRRRLWLTLLGLGVLMVAVLGVGYALVRHAGNRDLDQALAETDRLDPGWRLEDLEAQRRPLFALLARTAVSSRQWRRSPLCRQSRGLSLRSRNSTTIAPTKPASSRP